MTQQGVKLLHVRHGPVFHRNGIAYAFTRECIMQQRTIMGQHAETLLIDGATVNIDTEEDLLWAEFLWQQNEGVMREAHSK